MKEAWFSDPKGARGDFSFVDIDFWNKTQHRFLRLVRQIEEGQDADELLGKWQKEIWLFARQDFDERVFTNPYEPVDLKRVMTARKKYFTTSAEKQSAKAARRKSRRLLNEYCKEEHKATLRKWHEELQEKRGERASLRRSTTVNDVCLTDGFRLFLKNRQIKWQDEPEWRITALALIAAVSANVKAIDERQPFAAQLAAVMSKGRFTRLSAVKTPDELLRQLRRAVRLLNGSVNLDSLAEGVFRWCQESDDLLNHHRRQQRPTEFIRIRWALEYYQAGDADNEQNQ